MPPATRLEALRRLVAECHDGRVLAEAWTGSQRRHAFLCRAGHRFEARPANVIHRGSWCPVCAGNAPRELAPFEALARERGGELLPGQHPVGAEARLAFRCARGHRFTLHLRTLGERRDGWCAACALIEAREREYRALVRVATRAGYTVLTSAIVARGERIRFRCPAGHEWQCRSYAFRAGTRCGLCFRASTVPARRDRRRRLSEERVRGPAATGPGPGVRRVAEARRRSRKAVMG